jgi:hypothetical protein
MILFGRQTASFVLWLPLLAVLWSSPALAGEQLGDAGTYRLPVASLATTLDTDHQTDWITAYPCTGPSKGAYYCIDVETSETHSTQTLLIEGGLSGVRIVSRDVDGDHLPDILVMTGDDGRPLGIWLNDGHGGFHISDPHLYPASIWHEDPLLFPTSRAEQFPLASMTGVQTVFLSPHRYTAPLSRVSQSPGGWDSPAACAGRTYQNSQRAPPIL